VDPSLRQPAVAGRFYPRDPRELRQQVQSYLAAGRSDSPAQISAGPKPNQALGCVVPHAGYMYSGHVAGAVFARLAVPPRCIVLCPNHTGTGRPLAIMSAGEWATPLGNVAIDSRLAEALKKSFPALQEDSAAHRMEHAAEVELPFLQELQPHLSFVPIALGTSQFDVLEQLGLAIAEVIASQPGRILIIASSDMNHYESDVITRVKDHQAIERILALDARGLHHVVIEQDISMCGLGPTVAMLTAACKLGAASAELVKYATSGDISADLDRVVGYAGLIIA
jgi:AmmeMemoRadiSam system protein B